MTSLAEKRYHVYGQTLQTKENFDHLLTRGAESADLCYIISEEREPSDWQQAGIVYQSSHLGIDGAPRLVIWRQLAHHRVRLSGVATYDLTPSSIVCHPCSAATPEMLQVHLLGPLMSLWLEQQGIPALHASAVVVNGHTAAFLSHSNSGKSALAATLMQVGYPLLTDDVLPVDCCNGVSVGHPGYPQMRLWPDEAQYFLGDYRNLEQVYPAHSKRRVPVGPGGFGSFCDTSQPLTCLYLPARYDPAEGSNKVEIAPVSSRDAVVELIRYSFAAHIVEALGLQPRRLDFFAQMIQQIPMRRLIYPSGLDHLPAVRDAILTDIDHLSR